jgi:hypothetical protein
MPFTLAHAVVCIPLARTGLVVSALVVGSLSPDFAYFFPVRRLGLFSHSFSGIFLFCLPMGLIALWIFHRFLKLPILTLLPANHRKRLTPLADEFGFRPWRHFGVLVVSLAVGALTHVVWDSFTHSKGWVVANLAWLKMPLVDTPLGAMTIYIALKHASTLVGIILLGWWYCRWLGSAPSGAIAVSEKPSGGKRAILFAAIGLLALGLALIYATAGVSSIDHHPLRKFLNRTTIALIFILTVDLMIYAGCWHLKQRTTQVRDE